MVPPVLTHIRAGRIITAEFSRSVVPPFGPAKDAENIRKHGLSLAFGANVIADLYSIEAIDDSFDYGEDRWNAIGMVDGTVYVATYTDREDGVRFISVRAASKKETDLYFQMRR